MVVIEVHKQNIKTKFKSRFLSKATLIFILCNLSAIILPYIFAYYTQGFWMKRYIIYEQPNVKFRGDYLFIGTTNDFNHPIICSNLQFYKKNFVHLDDCTLIKIRENDVDFDGKTDELIVALKMNLPENTRLTSITIVIPIDYKLEIQCVLQMHTAIIHQEFLSPTLSHYFLRSNLKLYQSSPIFCNNKHIYDYYNYSLTTDLNDIFHDYSTRNVTTQLTNFYRNFLIENNAKTFELHLNVRFGEDEIHYKPTFWQMIKWAWIQYFAIYIVISWFITKIKDYIFNHRLVLFYKDCPFNKRK